MQDFKKRQASHLEIVLAEQGIRKKTLAEIAGVTAQAFSAWINGGSAMRESSARRIHEKWPEYPIEWLMGFTELRNERDIEIESALSLYQENKNRYYNMEKSVFILAKLGGNYEISNPHDLQNIREYQDALNEIEAGLKEYVRFSRGDQSITLTADECIELVKEISSYVDMRIKLMLERGRW